jgi:hypothetical protein
MSVINNGRNIILAAIGSVLIVSTGCSVRSITPPERFASPDAAVARLTEVVSSGDSSEARKLFGSDGEYLLDSGDRALDQTRADLFTQMFQQRHELRPSADGQSYAMLIGDKGWPFPVPLTKSESGWIFDAQAGKEEVLARRIGENEFSALETARAVYHAQRSYAAQDRNGDGSLQYAERLISTPGNHDGLYWPADEATGEQSPLNAVVARAAKENYSIAPGAKPQPFHGYYHRLIYSAPEMSSRLDPLSRPGRYWLVSSPAVWNETGVMTFALNERGWIYEKDLGEGFDYDELASIVIDDTWRRVE